MSDYQCEWRWTCPGCGKGYDLKLRVTGRTLAEVFDTARLIANEKLKVERNTVGLHAGECRRPV